ncbi:MAG: argininosuccinate lyase [Pseudomonadota bacterium]|nr:argininosuccinate lyase [Pseudomonadota bacterium]
MKKTTNSVWGGRFEEESSSLLKEINNSINFDYQLAYEDIKLSKSYAASLRKSKLLKYDEYKKIDLALNKILKEIESGKFKFSFEYEDIHMNIEMALKKKIGKLAGKIHTGKSRNDQVATDLKLWVKEKLKIVIFKLNKIQISIIKKAESEISVIMPGFTHSQNAQPILYSHYLLAFFEMLERDKRRSIQLLENLNECPLGSGALAGTNFFEIDRKQLANNLGFAKPTENSLDSVSDRDFVIEFLSVLSILSMHFSRISEDFIIWSSSAYGLINFPDNLCTGSSLMPQKKNPDAAELVRAKCGRIFSSLINLLIIQKGLPSGYSKDLQEDKEPIFDANRTINLLMDIVNEMIISVKINKKKMYELANSGYTTATDLADWMVKNINLTFREAHQKTGEIVLMAEKKKKLLSKLTLDELKTIEPNITKDVFDVLSVENSISRKKSYGGTDFEQVKKAIKRAKRKLE